MVQQNQINDKNLANIESTNKYNADKRAQTLTNQKAIDTKINGVDKVYSAMDTNNPKYDFTTKDSNGKPILSSLTEDRTLATALIKDNATYLAEQNNLYVVGTLTMATLLVAAILISK
jgi:hypothetical protein